LKEADDGLDCRAFGGTEARLMQSKKVIKIRKKINMLISLVMDWLPSFYFSWLIVPIKRCGIIESFINDSRLNDFPERSRRILGGIKWVQKIPINNLSWK